MSETLGLRQLSDLIRDIKTTIVWQGDDGGQARGLESVLPELAGSAS
jgi:hypothetical protein